MSSNIDLQKVASEQPAPPLALPRETSEARVSAVVQAAYILEARTR
jgi:hypothetical protein